MEEKLAHSLAPNDPAIDRAWKSAPPPLTPEQNIARLRERMDALDATPEAKAGAAEAIRTIEAKIEVLIADRQRTWLPTKAKARPSSSSRSRR